LSERLRILLSGMVAGDPHQGGATWAVLQYLVGLRELGHEVVLVEPVDELTPDRVRYFESLPDARTGAALLKTGSDETAGMPFDELARFAADADLLINVSGMLADERLTEPIPSRAFLDLDPGFVQVWHATGEDMGFDRHTHFVTVGQAVGSPDCPIPTCGRDWITTLPPVALDHWPAQPRPPHEAFTTVGHWRSYGSMEHDGIHYGQRAHSLRALIELPRHTDAELHLALGIHLDETDDLAALRDNGWRLVDPTEAAGTPERYADFIRSSAAELCIAKLGYVASRSGWFSDRSACYLASGRPVVAQETGFGNYLPTGAGLIAFSDVAEAANAIDEVRAGWERHAGIARDIAGDLLDSRVVLTRLLGELAPASA
jgi:hypothetical protein